MRPGGALAALLTAVIIAAPVSAAAPGQADAQRYAQALLHADYHSAYARLTRGSQTYYGSEANFGSWFRASHVRVERADVRAQRGAEFTIVLRGMLFDFTQERIVPGRITFAVSAASRGIEDRSRPRKTATPSGVAAANGATAIVRDIEFYEHRIALRLTLVNTGSGFATFLPYNKTVLKDQDDRVYPLIAGRDWALTDRPMFAGLRLAGNAEYTGVMCFRIPTGATPRQLHLEIAPVIRAGADARPFALSFPTLATDAA